MTHLTLTQKSDKWARQKHLHAVNEMNWNMETAERQADPELKAYYMGLYEQWKEEAEILKKLLKGLYDVH